MRCFVFLFIFLLIYSLFFKSKKIKIRFQVFYFTVCKLPDVMVKPKRDCVYGLIHLEFLFSYNLSAIKCAFSFEIVVHVEFPHLECVVCIE